jgi:hypothetical protein
LNLKEKWIGAVSTVENTYNTNMGIMVLGPCSARIYAEAEHTDCYPLDKLTYHSYFTSHAHITYACVRGEDVSIIFGISV